MDVIILTKYMELAKRTYPDLGSHNANYNHLISGIITEHGELLDAYKKNHAYKKPLDMVNVSEEFADGCWYFANLSNNFDEVLDIKEAVLGWNYFGRRISKEFESPISAIIQFTVYLGKSISAKSFDEAFGYWWELGKYLGIDREKALENNIAKLKARFPDKFSEESALNRDLNKERQILEN